MEKVEPKIRRLHDQVVRAVALRVLRSASSGVDVILPTEMELSQQLDVSRNVLREAVKVLVSKGLIEVRPKIGMRIRPRREWSVFDPDVLSWLLEVGPDEKFFDDLTDIRTIVETAAAERAAERATDDDIAELERCCERMAATVDDNAAHIAADVEFHAAIIAACHNELLTQINAIYWPALQASFQLTSQIPGARAATVPFHKAVADAIRSHDRAGARAAMEQLLVEIAHDLDRVFHDGQAAASRNSQE
jgi:GntR family transcriptional regulator, galactonate operon transcriptional repressor